MEVIFYNCSDDPDDVPKNNKTTLATWQCDVYEDEKISSPLDVESPTLLVSGSSGILNCNYCYIATFGRYYYVKMEQLPDGRQLAHCNVDVLMSFWNDFKLSNVVAIRSTSSGFANMVDEKVATTPNITRRNILVKQGSTASTPFDTENLNIKNCVLTVAGKTQLDNLYLPPEPEGE